MKRKMRLLLSSLFLGILFLAGCSNSSNFLDKIELNYNGYNTKGTASIEKDSYLSTLKKVAEYEGKKAKVDKKDLNAIIKSSETDKDLYDENKFNLDNISTAQYTHVQDYIEHMSNTHLFVNPDHNLKNNQKIKVTIVDNSEKPYFKRVSKSFKVKDLKEIKTISIERYAKDLYLKTNGTNGHARIEVTAKKGSIAYPTVNDLNNEFIVNKDKAYSNGEILLISEKKIADFLNEDSSKYKFSYVKNKNVKLTVSGLKDKKLKVDSLNKVFKQADIYVTDGGGSIYKAFYSNADKTLTIYEKAPNKDEYIGLSINCFLKNKTLYENSDFGDPTPLQNDSSISAEPSMKMSKQEVDKEISNLTGDIYDVY